MRPRLLATAILVTLLLALGLAAPAEATAARAIAGTITLTVNCAASPETTSIANNTDQALDLTTFRLSSIDQPRAGVEPFTLSGTLAVGQTATFQSGAGAAGNVLNNQFIYDNEATNEGAVLVTPFGTLTVLCSARTATLTLPQPTQTGPPPAPSTTATPAATPIAGVPTTTAAATRPATTPTAARPAPTTTTTLPGMPATGAGSGAEPLAQGAGLAALLGALALGGAAALRRRRAA